MSVSTSLTPDQAENATVATLVLNNLSPAVMGLAAGMLYVPWNRDTVAALHMLPPGSNASVELGLPESVLASFRELAVPVAELPLLVLQVRDRWQRDHLRSNIDALLNKVVEAQQAAAGMTSQAPAHVLCCTLMGTMLDFVASTRMVIDPLPVLLSKPPHEASTLVYLTGAELRTLATAVDMLAGGLLEEPANAQALRYRAQQLRDLTVAPPVDLPGGAAPTSGLIH